MQSWILNQSPGTYVWGDIATPEPQENEVRIRVVASALNHMDLWVTRGMPKPPLPHIPGCDVAGIVDAIGSKVTSVSVGDEVVVNPGVSPIEDIVRLGNNSPMGPGFMIWGEHCHGGHATFAIAPDRNVRPRPANRTWFESAAFPLAYLTALRMLNRARLAPGETVLIVGIGSFFYSFELMGMLYTNHVQESAEVFKWLMMGFIAVSTTYVFGTLLTANGNLKELNFIAATGMLLNISLNFILIPRLEAVGSAYSSIITQFLSAIVQVIFAQKVFKFKVDYRFLSSILIFAVGVIIINIFSKHFIEDNWIYNFIGMVILSIVFASFLKLLNFKSLLTLIQNKAK